MSNTSDKPTTIVVKPPTWSCPLKLLGCKKGCC